MSALRYIRRRFGSSTFVKMLLLIFVVFALMQLSVPAPPREPVAHSVAESPIAAQLISQKPKAVVRRPGQFYQNIIVHFDLKGAPPRVDYLLQMLDLTAKSGATGILLEWEDMFPYTGKLEVVRNTDAYSMADVKRILQHAKSLNLDVIPLVQTFGHLEWILKLAEFRQYRDQDRYSQVICLGDAAAVNLIKDALSQVIAAHAEIGIPYFHIGCDEAFAFGNCDASKAWMDRTKAGREELALTHMKELALHVMMKSPKSIVLAWNDMLKSFDTLTIQKLKLGDIIEPVVWDYSETIQTQNEQTWQALAANFPTVWSSSAYKGANFPSAQFIDIRHYEANNRAWIDHKRAQEPKFKEWRGIMITGWQRYDHMAALCEILPMGTPSLVLQVQTALAAPSADQAAVRRKAQSVLNCTDFRVANLQLVSNRCNFTGFQVYMDFQMGAQNAMQYVENELASNHQILGWLSPYARAHGSAQAWYLEQIEPVLGGLKQNLDSSVAALRKSMEPLFFENTIDEFISLSLGRKQAKIDGMLKDLTDMKEIRVWPRRHFPIKPATSD